MLHRTPCFSFSRILALTVGGVPPTCQVDMPVFFYIDPEFAEDPAMAKVSEITLSYTFFQAKEDTLASLRGPGNPHSRPGLAAPAPVPAPAAAPI